ncbi:LKAM1 protein, partial [Atractosteus spatula]|nr:LKAM1 protein [Atractosteus spatula]
MSATAKKEKFVPHNWKNVPGSELKKMSLLQKARYLAYEEPSKEVVNSVLISKQRLRVRAPVSRNPQKNPDPEAEEQQRKQDTVIGQLKAAEARNRVRSMRVRYQSMRAQEINHLISCQPTAQKAVRLELLLPAKLEKFSPGNDAVDKLEVSTAVHYLCLLGSTCFTFFSIIWFSYTQ